MDQTPPAARASLDPSGSQEVLELRRIRAAVAALEGLDEGGAALAAQVQQRIERDLLPRAEGRRPALIVGVVGPNNAGKSSVFNHLAGRSLSAVRATGGATRRLVGAAAAATVAGLLEGPGALGPFSVVPAEEGAALGLSASPDPHALCLAAAPGLGAGVLLVDSPDFDSRLAGHREASEALSLVSDLALVVVTKGSYLNAQVVDFLGRWLADGRPWVAVLNQSAGAEIARQQVAALAAQVGAPPRAAFHAAHDLAHQDGTRALAPEPLEGPVGLAALLADPGWHAALAAAARAASWAGLRADLAALQDHLAARAARARAALDHAEVLARRAGGAVAEAVLPAEPIVQAFHRVLDRRSGAGHRVTRGAAAKVGGAVAWLGRLGRKAPAPPPPATGLAEAERAVLEGHWARFFEDLARDLGAEALSETARALPGDLAARLQADLGRPIWTVRDGALEGLAGLPTGLDDYAQACEGLIEAECARRGDGWLQWLSTGLALAPALTGTVLIVTTGGLGADLATGAVTALSYWLYPRLVGWLGADLTRAAREAWVRPRSEALAELLLRACLPEAQPALAGAAAAGAALCEALAGEEAR